MDNLYRAARDEIDAASTDLNELSQEIWNHPEENFEEVHAHRVLTDFLEKRGLNVERNYILDTGFRSVLGSSEDGPHVAVLCEYDALPEIGHGCGHNLIAEVGIAAGLGIQGAFKAHGKPLGKLTILGTPAEEGDGGKIDMVNTKCFDDVDVAMMAHPSPADAVALDWLAVDQVVVKYHGKAAHASAFPWDGVNALDAAVLCYQNVSVLRQQLKPTWRVHVVVKYHGKAAHASAFPWDGVNALDAAVLCYQNVSVLRQQLKPTWRVHGIIKHGGTKPNIIPELTEMEFYARAPSKTELEDLVNKLNCCFQSAATATGCTAEVCWRDRRYLDVINNRIMCDLYHKHAKAAGVDFDAHGVGDTELSAGSTDLGNVSYVVPSIHPEFYIGTDAVNHTREFTEAAGDPKAQPYTLAVGKALAMTAIDIFTQKEVHQAIQEEFAKTKR